MPELNIRLIIDPNTGKKNLMIDYEADADALPHEHEEEHRALVDALIEGGVLGAEEVGKIIVGRAQREQVDADQAETGAEAETEGIRESVDQGS